MFLDSFKITSIAVIQISILSALGYFLVKKSILGVKGLNALSGLVIKVTLPVLIFCKLTKDFKFSQYSNWWIFPLLSILITIMGLIVGGLFSGFIKGYQHKLQFLSLVTFQNSGYLPLALVAALLPIDKTDTIFIYIFLFLLGFNLVIWSLGVYMLTFSRTKRFALGSLFSPPVIATVFSLMFVFFGLEKLLPQLILRPLVMIGDCTLPLAMLIVGGNLAEIHLGRIEKKAIFFMVLAKMIILPALGFLLNMVFKPPSLMGLLIIIQLAMPPATSLSVIIRNYKREDLLVSQGILLGHIVGLFSIPVFLSLYFTQVMIK